MKKKLLIKKYKSIYVLNFFLLLSSLPVCAQNKDIPVSSSALKLLKTIKINSPKVETPNSVDPNALYSDVTNYAGFTYANGGAILQTGNTITTLVADSVALIGTPPFSVGSFTFSVSNGNNTDVVARPRIRFYAADGSAGSPGTFLAGFSFSPISFTASSVQLYSGSVVPFAVPTQAMWAAITFDDNTGTSGATLAQLNLLGQGVFDIVDRGSSSDDYFQTDIAGSFLADNPVGNTYDFGGAPNPAANFGWEIISSVSLPVTLNNFKAQGNALINTLTWSTSQELNSNYFVIERSADGINFIQIGQVKAAGNSSAVLNYQFADAHPVNGINYYRLRIVDINNSGKYSEIKSVINNAIVNFTIYPNPAKNTILIEIDAEKTENAEVSITDINGRKILYRQFNITQGNNSLSVNVNKFSHGTYYIKIQLGNSSYTKKFNKL